MPGDLRATRRVKPIAKRRHGWHDFELARKEGFDSFGDAIHFVMPEYVFDDRLLDPDHPEGAQPESEGDKGRPTAEKTAS